MNTPVKLGAYVLGLCGVFGAAAGVGAAVGPVGSEPVSHTVAHGEQSPAPAAEGSATHAPAAHAPGGLQISEAGYTLEVAREVAAGPAVPVSLRILGPDGTALTDYEVVHDKKLHLIAVRRDLTGFQHVHPTLAPDGTWSVPLNLSAGTWRLFADFDPAGAGGALVLGTDVAVAGEYTPAALPVPRLRTKVDGYTVNLEGTLVAGQEGPLRFSVSRDGTEVTDLQPYLGAYGHLVALRAGDLAYLHVHPDGTPGDGTTPAGPVTFIATAPSAGDFRLFLDFRHVGVVRTAAFTVRVAPGPAADSSGEHADDDHAH
ncbi:hypothetical protein [Sporichthya polymorpha]|uniref:hypothetical protein n=1 Tax=Sporichthya polymorpha TaxID=35751 RepID=UPI00037D65FD|nr:hypothetical protein [Sporichthya polymorpha]